MRQPRGWAVGAVLLATVSVARVISGAPAAAGDESPERITVLLAPDASDLERYAAEELCNYLKQVYGIETQPSSELPREDGKLLLVGNPETNPLVQQALTANGWPKVSDQGIVLKPARWQGQEALIVGGGSPAATLWAAYELVQRWGVRFLLHGDVLPDKPPPLAWPSEAVVREPVLRVRQWRVINDFAMGPESWGLDEYRRVLDQLARLRFNRVYIAIYPYQPFLPLEAKGVRQQSATLWYGFHYPITDDMPGRTLFGVADEFWNPDLPRPDPHEAFAAAGERLVSGIIEHARRRGMKCTMVAHLLDFPPEFGPLLKSAQPVHQLGAMWVVPGADTDVEDEALGELAGAVLRQTVRTYPDLDYLQLGMPEFRQWSARYTEAWKALDAKYRISGTTSLEDVIAKAERRTDYPGGAERAVQEVKGDLVALRFYDRLLTEQKVLSDSGRKDVRFVFDSVAEELFPVLPRIVPAGSETLNFVDYTPSRIVKRREALARIPARDVPSSLIYTLHDDNVGVLPQLTTSSLAELTRDLARYGWAGFSTRYWLIGDHDPCVAYLSRAAWDADVRVDDVYRDLLKAVCGAAATDDMLAVLGEVEAATVLLEWHGLGLTFPVPGMIMKHWQPAPLEEPLVRVREHYQAALERARRAWDKAQPHGRGYIGYWIGRLEFGVGYFDMIEAVRRAAQAEEANDKPLADREAQAALGLARQALESYARVARDQSDRGAIATMAEYVYRPLKAKAEELASPE